MFWRDGIFLTFGLCVGSVGVFVSHRMFYCDWVLAGFLVVFGYLMPVLWGESKREKSRARAGRKKVAG